MVKDANWLVVKPAALVVVKVATCDSANAPICVVVKVCQLVLARLFNCVVVKATTSVVDRATTWSEVKAFSKVLVSVRPSVTVRDAT